MMDGDWAMMAVRLGLATFIGLLIGFEREWHGHDAGLRTHALVSLSSAMIVISALLIAKDMNSHGQESDPVRAIQGLAQAVGFIAGGLIFVRGGDVRNMTTAASLWMSAAIGIAAGAGQFALVVVSSAIALVVLTVLTLLKRFMPPRSIDPADEAHGDVRPPNRRGMISDD
ncbi:MgtC/SapB family protein [Sphingobium sp. AN641]|uniref:MgtC/SapB family protein n=1 Tax=Sphingobium sp. AN641 TaxID=3133443 RepID=UPI0030C338A4